MDSGTRLRSAPGTSIRRPATCSRTSSARTERLDPDVATTAFIRENRHGKGFVDSTRSGGATVVAAYSPRIRPGVPVSFPVPWDELDHVVPAAFTLRTATALLADSNPWHERMPEPQLLPADLVEEGRAIPIPRVQAMHEGKRRAPADRSRRTAVDGGPGYAPPRSRPTVPRMALRNAQPARADLLHGDRPTGRRIRTGCLHCCSAGLHHIRPNTVNTCPARGPRAPRGRSSRSARSERRRGTLPAGRLAGDPAESWLSPVSA